MLEYDRIDNSKGIDSIRNKLVSKECWMCHFWFYLDKNFDYENNLCNGCHEMSVKAVSMNNLAVVYVGGNAYRLNFAFLSKSDAVNLIKNAVIMDKRGTL